MVEWRDIPGIPNYQVSDDGRVRNTRRLSIIRPSFSYTGQLSVNLYLEHGRINRAVNRLVLGTYAPLENPDPMVNYSPMHLDGDPENCALINLEWTPRWRILQEKRLRRR